MWTSAVLTFRGDPGYLDSQPNVLQFLHALATHGSRRDWYVLTASDAPAFNLSVLRIAHAPFLHRAGY